jgi:membrane protein YdbS with pleckstrin-like domain
MRTTIPEGTPGARVEPALRRLDPRVVRVWRLTLLGEMVLLILATLVLERIIGRWIPAEPLTVAVAVLGVVLSFLWPPASYDAWGYRVRARDLFVRRGVLWRTTSIIPHARIQHVDMRRGPLERALGLASVVVYTAGIRGAELTIPGLPVEEAEAVRDQLGALGGGGDAV